MRLGENGLFRTLGAAENYCETLARPVRLRAQHSQIEADLSQFAAIATIALRLPFNGHLLG
jgi:hypothetical protein